jgi:hypothetical protein
MWRIAGLLFASGLGLYFWRSQGSAWDSVIQDTGDSTQLQIDPLLQVQGTASAAGGTIVQAANDFINSLLSFGGTMNQSDVATLAQQTCTAYFTDVDWRMLVSMAKVESQFDPKAARTEYNSNGSIRDVSYGLMQVLMGTAAWEYQNLGATVYGSPTANSMQDPAVNMYFGAAYVHWLINYHGGGHSEEWIVRAYNGGPGWATTASGLSMTANHWAKYKQAKRDLGYA